MTPGVEEPAVPDERPGPGTPPPDDSASGEGGALEAVAPAQRLRPGDIFKVVGPGLITGGADNDPAGIVTYSVVGAQSGFTQNWVLLLAMPLLIVIQEMCARVGNVTKTDLGTALRLHFGRKIATAAILLAVIANVLTIGADLVMMASVLDLITGQSFLYFIVPATVTMTVITIFLDYSAVRKYLLWLVGVFAAYIVSAFLANPDWASALRHTVVPSITFNSTYFLGAVGLLGTTITPYLFFWQASAEIEEHRGVQGIRKSNLDVASGMIWSNVTSFFMIVVTATVLHPHNSNVDTAAGIAQALEPLAGSYAKYLFATGIIGAGLLAIPVLAASTAYSVAGLFGWPQGLGHDIKSAPQFYLVLSAALVVGVQLAVSNVNPVKSLFYSQVLDGLVAPVLIVLVLMLTSSRTVMGEFVNSRLVKSIGSLAVVVLVLADVAMVYTVATGGLP